MTWSSRALLVLTKEDQSWNSGQLSPSLDDGLYSAGSRRAQQSP